MPPTGTVRNDTVRHVLATAATQLGDAPEHVAAAARVRLADIETRERCSRATLHRLWRSIVARHGGPLPALAANALVLERLGPFGFGILTAPSGLAALGFAAATFPIINDFGRLHVMDGARVRVRVIELATGPGAAISLEAILACFTAGLRRVVGTESLRLSFAHARPSYARAYRDTLGAGVVWDAATTELSIDRRVLEHAPAQADAATFEVLRAHVGRDVERLTRVGPSGSVVAGAVAGRPERDLGAVARDHGVSERTLRRRLRAEGTSFRVVRDGERARDAELLLADPGLSIAEVARALGFSEPSAFARAYRRWTGRAPSAARRGGVR